MLKKTDAMNIDPGKPLTRVDPEAQQEASWLATLLEAVCVTPADIVLIGQARSGKTVLANMLRAVGVAEAISEHQMASEAAMSKNVHLIALRQYGFETAYQVSQALGKKVTADELLALPRGQAVIRLAGHTSIDLIDIARPNSGPLFSA